MRNETNSDIVEAVLDGFVCIFITSRPLNVPYFEFKFAPVFYFCKFPSCFEEKNKTKQNIKQNKTKQKQYVFKQLQSKPFR